MKIGSLNRKTGVWYTEIHTMKSCKTVKDGPQLSPQLHDGQRKEHSIPLAQENAQLLWK